MMTSESTQTSSYRRSLKYFVLFSRVSLQWLILCCLALTLNGSNLLGYTRARLGTSEAVTKRMTSWVMRTVLRRQTRDPETQGAQQ